MKKFLYNNKFIISILLTLLLLSVGLFSLSVKKDSKADTSVLVERYTPFTDFEEMELFAPSDVCYTEDYTAIIDKTPNGDKLIVYSKTQGLIDLSGITFEELKQVKGLSPTELLVLDNTKLKKIDLENKTSTQLVSNGETIGCNFFDTNGEYLLTAFSSKVEKYNLSNLNERYVLSTKINADNAIAINSTDFFFVNKDGKLSKQGLISSEDTATEIISATTCTKTICNDQYLYYLDGTNTVKRINLLNNQLTTLSANNDIYNLGNTEKAISGITLKNDNLLLSFPTENSVQEFKIENDKLTFTGYAIAKNKSAYNRINKTAFEIEVQNNTLAVLDGEKLTVIKDTTISDYSKSNYFNLSTDGSFTPNAMALGKTTILLANKGNKELKLVDLTTGNSSLQTLQEGNNVIDICYQAGVYYILELKTGSGKDVQIYTLNETNGEISLLQGFLAKDVFGTNSLFTVNVNGDVYVTSDTKDEIYVFNRENNYASPEEASYQPTIDLIKLSSDLNGTLFGLTENSVAVYENENESIIPLNVGNVKSFALSYDSKCVYFIRNNEETIYKTNELPNKSITEIRVSDKFRENPSSATIEGFKTYSIKEGAKLFKVCDEDKEVFTYKGIYENYRNEYFLVCDYTYQTEGLSDAEFAILIGYDSDSNPVTIAVNKKDLSPITNNVQDAEGSAFITTNVSVYYIPVITEEDDFVILNGENLLRLDKQTEITLIKKITFLDKNFYYAKMEIEGEIVFGYIPEDFTVKTLFEDAPVTNQSSQLASGGKHLRNALIIMLVSASVFATSVYFILKKKD